MSVDESLLCSFQILKPAEKVRLPFGRGDASSSLSSRRVLVAFERSTYIRALS